MKIGIIGAGASGMAAAITAARDPGNEVILLERQARVGRKLQATGNGRCNLTHMDACADDYNGEEKGEFVRFALERYGVEDTLAWFREMGLFTVAESSGRVYPYSDQANSVVDVLRFALQKPNIRLLTGFEVQKCRRSGEGFVIESENDSLLCDRLIIACGGLAGSKLGGSMSGYKLLRAFGHHCTKLRPALVQLKSDWSGCVSLKGVRANCWALILRDGQLHSAGKGELQFTEYGLSGPVIFEISRDVCAKPGNWVCALDLLPDVREQELLVALKRRQQTDLCGEDLLTGILHNRLGRVVCKEAGINPMRPVRELTEADLRQVCDAVKHFEVHLTEPMGMDSAQVTAGGVLTTEFHAETMESRLVPGLFACGEVLDVDGDCGGYNLQWAWSSGRMAGLHAGKDI